MTRRLPALTALAALVVVAVAYLARDDGAAHRAEGKRTTSASRPQAGGRAGRAGPGERDPGAYELRVDGGHVTVTVHPGRAAKRGEGGPRAAGADGALSDTTTASAAEPNAEAVPAGNTTRVTGRVVDGAQRPIAGARIWVGAKRAAKGRIAATTDAAGRYRADDVAGLLCFVGARADGRAPSNLRLIVPSARAVFEMDFVLRDAGGALCVEVRDDEGKPVAGAAVIVGDVYLNLNDKGPKSPEGYPAGFVGPRHLTTDSAGRAEALDLPPQWNPLRVVAAGFAPYFANVRLTPAAEETMRIRLERGVVVHGTVRDAAGVPVAGAHVGFRPPGSKRELDIVAVSDERGEYRIDHVPARRVEVFARADDGRAVSASLSLDRGETRRWDAVLADPRELTGRVVYEDGSPAAGARVRCRRARFTVTKYPEVTTDETGGFRFAPVEPVEYEILVWHPQAKAAPPTRLVRVMPDGPKTITLPREPEQPGYVAGLVVLPDGKPAVDAKVAAWPEKDTGWSARDVAGADGRFLLGPLGAGGHQVEVHIDGQPTFHLEVEIKAGETHDFGVLKFPTGGRIRARIVGTDGAASVHRTYVFVTSLDERIEFTTTPDGDGFVLSEVLAPGRYLVSGAVLGLSREVEVRSGETTRVELKLPSMGRLAVTFVGADGEAPRELSYDVRDEAGRRIAYGTLDAGTNRLDVTLAAGTYTVAGTDEHGHTAAAKLAAPADGETAQTLTLR